MPIAGPTPPTPGLTSRRKTAESSYQDWKNGIPKRNATVYGRVLKSQKSELADACWSKTLLETEAGWLTEPVDVTPAMMGAVPLTPRYAISEQHGNSARKIRLIDDFRASGINSIITTEDANIPDALDVFMAIASYFALAVPGCDLLCATADFAHAYKHIPILEDQREFATILLAPPTGPLKAATLRTQPFGARRAPTNWPRVTLFLKWAMLVFSGTAISIYVDDVFVVEPAETIESACRGFRELCAILGFQSGGAQNNNYRLRLRRY